VSAVGAAPVEAARLAQPGVVVRRRRPADWHAVVVHALLLACIAVVAFPLYYAFVISTQDLQQVVALDPVGPGRGDLRQDAACQLEGSPSTTRTPTNPVTTAAQRRRPTRSPKTMAAPAVSRIGPAK